MKRLLIILTSFFIFLNGVNAQTIKTVSKDYKVITSDGFNINAKLEYPKVKSQMEYKTVLLLHSMGYSSQWWEELPQQLLENGYAVLLIDFRGHGNSVYNSKLSRVSWKNLTNKAYAKYPNDVYSVIEKITAENKRKFFNDWAIVGCDIGASTAIYVANKIPNKPKTLVLLSPSVNTKGLYIPVKLAELNNIDVLSITGENDISGKNAEEYLKRFSQSTFATYSSESKSTGMLMLKNDPSLSQVITSWINQYLK